MTLMTTSPNNDFGTPWMPDGPVSPAAYLPLKDVAERLGLIRGALCNMHRRGEIKLYKFGGAVRVKAEELAELERRAELPRLPPEALPVIGPQERLLPTSQRKRAIRKFT